MVGILLLILLTVLVGLFFLGKGKGTPVLLYHQVNPLVSVTPALFEEHLKYIAARYRTFTCSEAYEYVQQHGALPGNSLFITFDDGYYDNYKVVYPLLKKYDLKATFFINTLFISPAPRKTDVAFEVGELANIKALGNYYETGNGTSEQYMTAAEIQEMQASGLCDFQAHTHTHAPVFISNQLTGFRSAQHTDSSPIHLYQGKVKEGYPVFKSRSTMVAPGYKLDLAMANLFAAAWQTTWKTLPKKEAIKEGEAFVKQHALIVPYSEEEARARVVFEIEKNKEELTRITGKPVNFFAWTWGHQSAWGREILKQQGIKGFISTRKGSMGLKPNWDNLKRVELRDPSMNKLRRILAITSNSFTSWVYSMVS